jgi:hypothetical protein
MQPRTARRTITIGTLVLWGLASFACDQAHPGIAPDVQDVAASIDSAPQLDVAPPLDADDAASALDAPSDDTTADAANDAPLPSDTVLTDAITIADASDVVSAPMPDFTLPDVNPNSATNGMNVSPRAHLGEVTAWYFGHST